MGTSRQTHFGTGRLLVSDARLAFMLLNEGRYWTFNRVFGLSREQANVLTLVFMLGAGDAAYEGVRKFHMPRVSATNAGIGAFGARAALAGVAGPSGTSTPGVPGLIAFALIGGAALPTVRRALRQLRLTEERIRKARIERYRTAAEAFESARVRVAEAVAQATPGGDS